MRDFTHYLSCVSRYSVKYDLYRPKVVAIEIVWELTPCGNTEIADDGVYR